MSAFDSYIGKHVLLGSMSVEILRLEIRGQRVWLVGRDDASGKEILVSLRAILKNAARRSLRLLAVN